MKANLLLAKLENLLAATKALQNDESLGANSQKRIDDIKEKVNNFIANIKNVRKKVKPDVAPKPPKPKCKNCPVVAK